MCYKPEKLATLTCKFLLVAFNSFSLCVCQTFDFFFKGLSWLSSTNRGISYVGPDVVSSVPSYAPTVPCSLHGKCMYTAKRRRNILNFCFEFWFSQLNYDEKENCMHGMKPISMFRCQHFPWVGEACQPLLLVPWDLPLPQPHCWAPWHPRSPYICSMSSPSRYSLLM